MQQRNLILIFLFNCLSFNLLANGSKDYDVFQRLEINEIKIRTMPSHVVEHKIFKDFLEGRSVYDIDDFKALKHHTTREIVEWVILLQAIKLGGIDLPVILVPSYQYSHPSLTQLIEGQYVMDTDSHWLKEVETLEDKVWITDPSIKSGQMEAALYTSPKNSLALNIKPNQLNKLTAISNQDWLHDWHIINQLNVKKVTSVRLWVDMYRTVEAQMVDFMLAPFSINSDLRLQYRHYYLVPIPNMKVSFKDSRHFILSKAHPLGEVLHEAINKGMRKLRKEGKITRAFNQSGIFNDQVKNWQVINP